MGYNTLPSNPWPLSSEQIVSESELQPVQAAVAQLQEDVGDLQGDVRDLGTSKTNQITIAPTFNAEASYSEGDIVYYNGLSYKCINAHTGEWDATDFEATTIVHLIQSVQPTESRTRNNITANLTNLFTAISEQDLTKYGYNIGDYFTGASGYTYTLADIDTFYGGYSENAVVNTHHVAVVVNTHSDGKWNSTDSTSGGYTNSLLRTTLNGTVLTTIKSDFVALFGGDTGAEHLLAHKLLLSTSSGYDWTSDPEYISALSEAQVYGENVWTNSGTSTGEAWKWLEVFRKYSFNLILGNIWFWLRNIVSGSAACNANGGGIAHNDGASHDGGIVGLILIH